MASRWTLSLLFTGIIITLVGVQYTILNFIQQDDKNISINDTKNQQQHNKLININKNNATGVDVVQIINNKTDNNRNTVNNNQGIANTNNVSNNPNNTQPIIDLNNKNTYPNINNNHQNTQQNNDPIYIKVKADNYFDMGQYDKAVQTYEQLFLLTPNDTKAFKKAIISYIIKLKDNTSALNLSKKIYDSNQNDAMANNLYGWALLANNQINQSYQYLSRSIILDPNLAEGYLNLGEYFAKTGNKINAKKYWDRVVDLNGPNGPISNIAKILMELYKIN